MKTNPISNPKSQVFFKNFRVTVLKKGIIRIEKDDQLIFNDYPTQMVLNRNFKEVDFKYEINNDCLTIFLTNYSLFFTGDIKTSYIVYKDKKLKLNNDFNLKGTYQTVDGMDGEIQTIPHNYENSRIKNGIVSSNGVAILDDSNSYCFDENFQFSHQNKDELDIYVFFYPNLYKEAIKDFFEISGYPPKLPKYVFGNWWSRFYSYTDEKYLYLMDKFKENNIPLTVATVDMDWHYSSCNGRNILNDLNIPLNELIKNPKIEGCGKYYPRFWNDRNNFSMGWTGYTWNKKLFPDYEKFLKELHKRNLAVTLNLHPADGISFYEDLYEKCAKRVGIDPSTKEDIPFDLTDETNKSMYFEEILNFYENKGVDFWWIDWQQGEFSKYPGLTPMWLCNHYFYLDREKHTNRPLILSRFCGLGGQRYPLGFSGDSFQTFDSLKYIVKTTALATNAAFTYWSHDIGGHMNGYKDGDLYLKFIQFGVFSPILRLHSSCDEPFSKEPWLFLGGYGELAAEWLRFRHKLIPYIYSHSLKTSLEGNSLIEPLYYYHPHNKNAYKYSESEYYFANDLLIAPYVEPKKHDDLNHRKVYFPSGTFYDLKYGYKYNGNKVLDVYREIGDMPAFIKEGSFLVLDGSKNGNIAANPQYLSILTTEGKGKYTFLEDKETDSILKTIFKNEEGKITFEIKGDKKLFNPDRVYSFKILNVFDIENIEVINAKLDKVSTVSGVLEFTISNVEYNKKVEIIYKNKKLNSLEYLIKQTSSRLLYVDDQNNLRNELYNQLMSATSKEEVVSSIKDSNLTSRSIKMLLEVANSL